MHSVNTLATFGAVGDRSTQHSRLSQHPGDTFAPLQQPVHDAFYQEQAQHYAA
jgi:hypothetical protein